MAEARVLSRWGRLREAAAVAIRALGLLPAGAREVAEVAATCLAAGDAGRALSLVEAARSRGLGDRQVDSVGAGALLACGRVAEAGDAWGRLADADPGDLPAWLAAVESLIRAGDLARARSRLDHVLELAPRSSRGWLHLGALRAIDGDDEGALEAFARAETLGAADPACNASANRAIVLFNLGRWRECRAILEASLPLRPDLNGHMQLGPTLLALGEFDEGWRQYEFRWLVGRFERERPAWVRPHWEGQDLVGRTILVVREQGIGDLFQFSRYFPLLKARGARVVLQVSGQLRRIAERLPGVDLVIDDEDGVPRHDYFVFLLSLPRVFGTRVDTIPPCAAALASRAELAAKWRGRLGAHDHPRIGVVWAGRPEHARDRQRSLTLETLAPVLSLPGARFVGLQKGAGVPQAEHVPENVDWSNLGPEFDELDDAAAVIAELDLVVTVDTALAHLASVMGRPVWMLVANPPDFRWLLTGEDTPWYASMRLFRQARPGDWSIPVRLMSEAIEGWMREWHAARRSGGGLPVPPAAPVGETRAAPAERRVPGLLRALPTCSGFMQYDPDDVVGGSIESQGAWLQPVGDAAVALASRGSVVIEASPGVGMHAIPIARRLGPQGHLLLFEPAAAKARMLAQNLRANRLDNVTLLQRRLGGTKPAVSPDVDTIDGLGLERLGGIKVNAGADPVSILQGADQTLWRCRPWLLMAADDEGGAAHSADFARRFGYRTSVMRTPFVSPDPSPRAGARWMAGGHALTLVALPEELRVDIAFPDCVELT